MYRDCRLAGEILYRKTYLVILYYILNVRKQGGVFSGMNMGIWLWMWKGGIVAGVMRCGMLTLIIICQFMLWLLWWVEQNDLIGLEDWLDADLEIDLEWCGLGTFDLEMEDMVMCVRSGLVLGWLAGECAVLTAHRWGWNWNIPRAEKLGKLFFWK